MCDRYDSLGDLRPLTKLNGVWHLVDLSAGVLTEAIHCRHQNQAAVMSHIDSP